MVLQRCRFQRSWTGLCSLVLHSSQCCLFCLFSSGPTLLSLFGNFWKKSSRESCLRSSLTSTHFLTSCWSLHFVSEEVLWIDWGFWWPVNFWENPRAWPQLASRKSLPFTLALFPAIWWHRDGVLCSFGIFEKWPLLSFLLMSCNEGWRVFGPQDLNVSERAGWAEGLLRNPKVWGILTFLWVSYQ